MFSEQELAYLRTQPLARLATVDGDRQPTVDAVGFMFADGDFLVGGRNLPATRKHRNVIDGNAKVSLVVDDLKSIDPWRPRGIRVFATAEAVTATGQFGPGEYLRITPVITWSWGLEDREDYRGGRFTPKRTVW